MNALTNILKITYNHFCNSGLFYVTSRYRKSCNERGVRSETILALHPNLHPHTVCLNRVEAKALYSREFTFSSGRYS